MNRRSLLRASLLAATIAPVLPAMSAAPTPATVSPTLSALIAEYQHLTEAMNAIDASSAEWDKAADACMAAADALLDYRPTNLRELAAKAQALRSYTARDVDLFSMDVLVDDINRLAEEGE